MTAHEKITASHKNVFVALAAAQAEMEPVTKDAKNAAFKKQDGSVSRYADLAAVVDAVRPALTRNGLAYFHNMVMFDDKPAMRTTLAHGDSDTSIFCDVPLIVAANNMQGMKSATTYAKRIGLESVTGVAPEDDDGNAASKSPPVTEPARRHMPHERGPGPADIAAESLKGADSLDQLAAIWRDLPGGVKALPEVIGAKDNRKAELSRKPDSADFDAVPY